MAPLLAGGDGLLHARIEGEQRGKAGERGVAWRRVQ